MGRFYIQVPYLTDYSGYGAPVWEWQDNILFKPDESFSKEVENKFKEMPENQAGWAAYAPLYDNMIRSKQRFFLKEALAG